MSFTQILYHIVFCTKNRENTLPNEHHKTLYKYIWGIIKQRQGNLYRINGTENHIHILCDLHPTICLSNFVKDIKTVSNAWIKTTGYFPYFHGWSSALTYSLRDKEIITNYIKKQKEHHHTESFEDELKRLLEKQGITMNETHILS